MRPYPYRISDYEIILVTEDIGFGKLFLDYFSNLYSPRNRKGFARVFVVHNCQDALELVSLERICVLVIDDNIQGGEVEILFTNAINRKIKQLLSLSPTKPENFRNVQKTIRG